MLSRPIFLLPSPPHLFRSRVSGRCCFKYLECRNIRPKISSKTYQCVVSQLMWPSSDAVRRYHLGGNQKRFNWHYLLAVTSWNVEWSSRMMQCCLCIYCRGSQCKLCEIWGEGGGGQSAWLKASYSEAFSHTFMTHCTCVAANSVEFLMLVQRLKSNHPIDELYVHAKNRSDQWVPPVWMLKSIRRIGESHCSSQNRSVL